MKRIFLGLLLIICIKSISTAQIIDTVYFDLQGEIIINEVAAYYRVAKFDTTSGQVIGKFEDFKNGTDSLICSGQSNNGLLEKYTGDSIHEPIAKKMLELKASYIRIRDYSELKNVIKLPKPMEERLFINTEYGQAKIIQDNPNFIGGFETLGWFIGQLIRYPEDAEKNNITGVVKLKFKVDIDGSITNISVLNGIGYGCDEEAVRVMKLVPDWLPGLNNGKPVPVYFSIPITFQ